MLDNYRIMRVNQVIRGTANYFATPFSHNRHLINPHQVIMTGLSNVVADGNILGIIEGFLKSGVMEDGVFKPTHIGTPQGGVISPLLANIALNYLDWHLQGHGLRFVRYADDFVVLCISEGQAKEALVLWKHF